MKSVLEQDIGFSYIAEQTSPDTSDIVVNSMNTYNSNGVFYIEFDTILHSFDVQNRNTRYYDGNNVMAMINGSERIQSYLSDNAWFGEQDHPEQLIESQKLTPLRLKTIFPPNRSHKIMRPELRGSMLHAHIQTSSGTDAGVGMAKEIIQGLIPAFSCRAIARIVMKNGKPYVLISLLITYDWVFYPSHKEAHQTTKATLGKPNQIFTESAPFESKDVMIPLQDIMQSVSNNDPNVYAIMEAFDLNLSDCLGFDTGNNHAIIRDKNNNKLYVNINPTTANKVDQFFKSL